MARKKQKKHDSLNKNWESEIAAYDEECCRREEEFNKHTIIINESRSTELTEEENQVLTLFLNGVSYTEIARQCKVDEELITGLLEVIRAKLSLME